MYVCVPAMDKGQVYRLQSDAWYRFFVPIDVVVKVRVKRGLWLCLCGCVCDCLFVVAFVIVFVVVSL